MSLKVELQNGLYDAYHRYLDAYCSPAPARLKAAALMNGRDPQWSATALRSIADKPWLAACEVLLPEGLPADDPSLDPIWEAMDEADLPLVHHSFFYEPPYFPGYRDIWGNLANAPRSSKSSASSGEALGALTKHCKAWGSSGFQEIFLASFPSSIPCPSLFSSHIYNFLIKCSKNNLLISNQAKQKKKQIKLTKSRKIRFMVWRKAS